MEPSITAPKNSPGSYVWVVQHWRSIVIEVTLEIVLLHHHMSMFRHVVFTILIVFWLHAIRFGRLIGRHRGRARSH